MFSFSSSSSNEPLYKKQKIINDEISGESIPLLSALPEISLKTTRENIRLNTKYVEDRLRQQHQLKKIPANIIGVQKIYEQLKTDNKKWEPDFGCGYRNKQLGPTIEIIIKYFLSVLKKNYSSIDDLKNEDFIYEIINKFEDATSRIPVFEFMEQSREQHVIFPESDNINENIVLELQLDSSLTSKIKNDAIHIIKPYANGIYLYGISLWKKRNLTNRGLEPCNNPGLQECQKIIDHIREWFFTVIRDLDENFIIPK